RRGRSYCGRHAPCQGGAPGGVTGHPVIVVGEHRQGVRYKRRIARFFRALRPAITGHDPIDLVLEGLLEGSCGARTGGEIDRLGLVMDRRERLDLTDGVVEDGAAEHDVRPLNRRRDRREVGLRWWIDLLVCRL